MQRVSGWTWFLLIGRKLIKEIFFDVIIGIILTPILMSILSSENAVRLNFIIHIMFLALFEMRNYNVLCGGAKWTI